MIPKLVKYGRKIVLVSESHELAGAWRTKDFSREDVRGLQIAKVNNHRTSLVDKLREFGAISLGDLDPKHYNEYYSFMRTLKP